MKSKLPPWAGIDGNKPHRRNQCPYAHVKKCKGCGRSCACYTDDELLDLADRIRKRYSQVMVNLSRDNLNRSIIDVATGETYFYINQRKNGNFCVNAVWPDDEKGRRNLTASKMVKSIGSIAGIAL